MKVENIELQSIGLDNIRVEIERLASLEVTDEFDSDEYNDEIGQRLFIIKQSLGMFADFCSSLKRGCDIAHKSLTVDEPERRVKSMFSQMLSVIDEFDSLNQMHDKYTNKS